jgi:hypothetical protein
MFEPSFDGVIKSEFLTHIDEIAHKQTQPSEGIILARNAELRKNPGAIQDLSWGRLTASIPFNMFEKAIRDGYKLNDTNAEIAAAAMTRYLQTPEGKSCLVHDTTLKSATKFF